MEKDFKISVITPVYNAEEFLSQTLECLEGQTVGFSDNVQLILINDGSTDGSDAICRDFAERYPENAVYISKENGGVSSARNEGIRYIKGKYTIFLDSDDIWDRDAFRKISEFFDTHYDETDVCSCRLDYIGSFAYKEHPQNFKFSRGSRIVDLEKEPECICTPIGNSVFKSAAVEGREFDTGMRYCEDTLFLNKVMAEKMKVGLIADAVFYYRKNAGGGNASLAIAETEDWYFYVPDSYYMQMIDFAIGKFGYVPRFLQETLIYDIKWRDYTPSIVDTFTEEQKKEHIDLMRKVLSYIDDEVILGTPGVNQYKKLYLLELKKNKDIMSGTVLDNDRFYYNGMQVMSLRGRSMLYIRSFDITDDVLSMDGVIRADVLRRPYRFEIRDEERNVYVPEIVAHTVADQRGFIGEMISEGKRFDFTISLKPGRRLFFYLILDGDELPFRPTFDDHIGIDRGRSRNYTVKCGYIITLRKNVLSFYSDSMAKRLKHEMLLDRELIKKKDAGWIRKRRYAIKMMRLVNDSRMLDRIAFISARSDGKLLDNMAEVYNLIDEKKVKYCDRSLEDPESAMKAAELLYTSRVVVTDDYVPLFRDNKKKDGQHYVQLWHAAGAFKKFGKETAVTTPGMERMYHRDYDLAVVSSEHVRDIYADAFQIEKDMVRALGLPRSDRFFDAGYLEKKKAEVREKIPETEGRQVILYAPTFRGEANRRVYMPKIDYEAVNNALGDDQIMILRPHPLMPLHEGYWGYDKIKLIQDVPTNDIMIAADLLITDYSSVIFEYSLLDKPMLFFCYDYDEYDRDFYLDYETDLPGEILKSVDELTEFLRKGRFETDGRIKAFREKYMSACDGRSSMRVAKAIEEYLYK